MKDMLGRDAVVSVETAREIFDKNFGLPEMLSEDISVLDAAGRITAKDIISSVDLPDFARSSMDGYAVRAQDTFGATENLPAYFQIIGEVLMGEKPHIEINKGTAAKISTGGMLPKGSDAVVILEHTQAIDKNSIEALYSVAPGENVVQVGEDIKKGEALIKKGHKIRPQDIGAFAGIGIDSVVVYAKPKVAVITTGNEIIDIKEDSKFGCVRDINSYYLSTVINNDGGIPVRKGIIKDDYSQLRRTIEESLSEADVVVLSGGSSVGARDLTAKVINDIGKPGVLIHGVSIKPGKPTIIGIVNKKPVFGLPGHPVAVGVSYGLFVKRVIRSLTGIVLKDGEPVDRMVKARLLKNIASASGREDHIRVELRAENNGLVALPILGKSGLISTLVKATGYLVIPENRLGIEAGEIVEVYLYE
jgi:molybdopterin molybdotransferase